MEMFGSRQKECKTLENIRAWKSSSIGSPKLSEARSTRGDKNLAAGEAVASQMPGLQGGIKCGRLLGSAS